MTLASSSSLPSIPEMNMIGLTALEKEDDDIITTTARTTEVDIFTAEKAHLEVPKRLTLKYHTCSRLMADNALLCYSISMLFMTRVYYDVRTCY